MKNLIVVVACLVMSCRSINQPTKTEATVNQAIKEAFMRNVFIETEDGSGSGVVIAPNIILTCKHMLSGHLFVNGIPARIISISINSDLMLLSIPTSDDFPAAVYATEVAQDEEIFIVSNPMSHQGLLVHGRIVDIARGFFFTDAHVFFGSSGSGAYNKKGELIGIVSAMEGESSTGYPYGIIIPISNLLDMFKEK